MQKPYLIKRIRKFAEGPGGKRMGMWLSFFIYWGGAAAILPYMSVYFESIGLRGGQIGQLNSIPYFITLVSSVTFAFISDVLKKHLAVLRLCVVGLIIILFIFPSISGFAAFVPVVLLYSIFSAPANPILDQTTLAVLDNPEKYGTIRAGGSIGWGIMALITGFLIDNLGIGLPVIFYINITFLVIFFGLTFFMEEPKMGLDEELENPSLRDLGTMFKLPGFLVFLLIIVVWGIGEASIQNFMFLHIKGLGGSSTLMGFALSVSLIGEILAFSFADRIQARLGHFKMILAAFLVLFAWLVGLSLIRNPNAIPIFQVFGGAGFALMQSGSVAYVNERAPKGLGTTAQALRGGVYAGLGVGFGAVISGFIYERAGSVLLYRNMAVFVFIGFVFSTLVYFRERKRGERKE